MSKANIAGSHKSIHYAIQIIRYTILFNFVMRDVVWLYAQENFKSKTYRRHIFYHIMFTCSHFYSRTLFYTGFLICSKENVILYGTLALTLSINKILWFERLRGISGKLGSLEKGQLRNSLTFNFGI